MLVIVHLVDSRKGYPEISKYISKVTRNEEIEHWFIFGGDPKFDASISEELLTPKDHAWIYREQFICSKVINTFITSPEFRGYLIGTQVANPTLGIFVNIRDMDDEYDDEQMMKETSLRENVGILRFNYNTKVNGELIQKRYGGFTSDYVIRDFFNLKYRPEGINSLMDAVMKEPHMIHRQFALINQKVIQEMKHLNYSCNKGEDTLFLAQAYLQCMKLKLPIVVEGSVEIGVYNRDSSEMTGNEAWLMRFVDFISNIHSGLDEISKLILWNDHEFFANTMEFIRCVDFERTHGNACSLRYHLEYDNATSKQ